MSCIIMQGMQQLCDNWWEKGSSCPYWQVSRDYRMQGAFGQHSAGLQPLTDPTQAMATYIHSAEPAYACSPSDTAI